MQLFLWEVSLEKFYGFPLMFTLWLANMQIWRNWNIGINDIVSRDWYILKLFLDGIQTRIARGSSILTYVIFLIYTSVTIYSGEHIPEYESVTSSNLRISIIRVFNLCESHSVSSLECTDDVALLLEDIIYRDAHIG